VNRSTEAVCDGDAAPRARLPGTVSVRYAADPAGGEVVTRTARCGAQRAGGDRGLSRACPFGFTLVSRDSNQYSPIAAPMCDDRHRTSITPMLNVPIYCRTVRAPRAQPVARRVIANYEDEWGSRSSTFMLRLDVRTRTHRDSTQFLAWAVGRGRTRACILRPTKLTQNAEYYYRSYYTSVTL